MWGSIFRGIASFLVKSAKTVLVPAAAVFIERYTPIAMRVVEELASQGRLTNETKRRLAFEKLKTELRKQGIKAKDAYINLLIEATVIKLQELNKED